MKKKATKKKAVRKFRPNHTRDKFLRPTKPNGSPVSKPARRAATDVQRRAVVNSNWKRKNSAAQVLSFSELQKLVHVLGLELVYLDGVYRLTGDSKSDVVLGSLEEVAERINLGL